jgi:gliding motility-associated-like protein
MRSTHFLFRFAALLALLSCFGRTNAQLTVSGAMTPTQLVQNVLLGPGVFAWNITYTGDPGAIGSFNGASSNIGLPSGILLTSGSINNAPGPNVQGGITTANGTPGDPDLNAIMAPTLSQDACVLEFDFIPMGDSLNFKFVFASDEYAEYANSSINDGFGFFLTGISAAYPTTNLAVLPSTTTPVTINTINCQNNSPFYICNDPNNTLCPASYGCPTTSVGTTVEYDGFTTVLVARAQVICGESYHIKIAIADGSDQILDSGVFLEGGSFTSTSTITMSSTVSFGGNDTVMYEGCSEATVIFDRGVSGLQNADTVYYTITGTGSNGLDYSFIADSVYFPPGQDTAFITIDALADALVEGTETVTLTAVFINSCTGASDTTSITLYLQDAPPLTVTASADTFITCPGEIIPLSAQAAGGVGIGGYDYTWNPSIGTGPNVNASPTVTTTYTVSATDSCGIVTATDQVTITVLPYTEPQVSVNSDAICLGDSTMLVAFIQGGLPQYEVSWTNGFGTNDTIVVSPATDSTYTVTITDFCGNQATASGSVTISSTVAGFSYLHVTNSVLNFLNQSAANVVSWQWDFGDGSGTSTLPNPNYTYDDTGTYTIQLVVTDIAGCVDTVTQTVIVLPDMYFYFPSAFTPNNDGKNDVFTGYGLGIEKYELLIFNRWGELLFKSEDMSKGWDGKLQGKLVQEDVYICVFNLVGDVDGVTKKVKHIGRVTLIR